MKWKWTLITLLLTGCFEDAPLPLGDSKTLDTDPGSSADTGSGAGDQDTATGFHLDLPEGPKLLYAGDYVGFEAGNDSWAPQGVPPIPDETHAGWDQARCFDCHGPSKPWPAEGHDPRMQYWAWSCARGFPGGGCHGHGVNGTIMFNHERDPAFDGCTQAGCHETYNAPLKDFENHGMNEVPTDEFCHACHDFYWEGWPRK